MTISAPDPVTTDRAATARHYAMCPPDFFAVTYAINPWMDPGNPVDRELARAQWQSLKSCYEQLGHRVSEVVPDPTLPDMVFAANGALVSAGRAVAARFRYAERQAESAHYSAALRQLGINDIYQPEFVNEGEGDFLHTGRGILAGHGFRSDVRSHSEIQEQLGLPVTSLRLIDPRFYHLDTALGVLDAETVAYFPDAFSAGSLQVLRSLFPDAIIADFADAEVLGLNLVSDGRNVVLPAKATGLATQLADRGFHPVGVELSELLKAGGGPKCCTLEIRSVTR
ncbi:MAG TPA: N-dimethylarginine dimethylaminohydrolase [Mycobacteriales bacterium]|nr:N-dimethylarginine dimethylaminohydrolase [Mycobacteriales bacterium]